MSGDGKSRNPEPAVSEHQSEGAADGHFSSEVSIEEHIASFNSAKEYAVLRVLRQQALKKQQLTTKNHEDRSSWTLLQMLMWKNLLIRKRRKSQFILLLLQIFLWFGVACFSIAFRSYRMEYSESVYDGPTQLTPRLKTQDFNKPIAVSYNRMYTMDQHPTAENLMTHNDAPVSDKWNTFQEDFATILEGVSQYYNLTYGGRAQPFRMFSSYDDMYSNMRDDKRIAYGIYADKLDIKNNIFSFKLVFWEKEVPISNDFNPYNCRPSSLTYRDEDLLSCDMKQYGRHGFTFVQTALTFAVNNELSRIRSQRMVNVSEVMVPPNRFRLELPEMSIVAERFPEHHIIRSQAAELAPSAPFYFMFALISVFSFVVMDMVMEKESKLVLFVFIFFRMKEIMKSYGLSSGMFWLSWLLTYAILNLIIVWCAMFICTIGGVFGPVTSYLIIALLLYLYLISLITMGFVISVFFQKQQTATIAGMTFNLLLYALGWMLHHTRIANLFVRGFFMLFSTITFSLAIIDLISMLPDNGVSIGNLFNLSHNNILIYLIFLIIDTGIYFFLAWYLDQVVQPDWGSTKHWTFIFSDGFQYMKRWYRLKFDKQKKTYNKLLSENNEFEIEYDNNDWIEPIPKEFKQKNPAIKIRNLVKRFPGRGMKKKKKNYFSDGIKTVVDLDRLDIYPGEIFGLLGHNGAGKTTTISMLTGMLQIDDGYATILGHSVKDFAARKAISVCPQQNLFFEDLNCLEHLIFFSALRGIDVTEGLEQAGDPAFFSDVIIQKRFLLEQRARIVDAIVNSKGETKEIQRSGILEMEQHFARFGLSLFTDQNVDYVHSQGRTVISANSWPGVLAAIEKVGLSEKLFNYPNMLSGGMKRRLWLAIALIGDPKILFLDEPTSGVDPLGRHELWRQIQDEKLAGRCIVITTHHMEEADILADRKAVMTAGKLRCLGSSLFLKTKFGIGYYLECDTSSNINDLENTAINILNFLRIYVPNAQRHINDNQGSAMAMAAAKKQLLLFSLPLSSVDCFADLFLALENEKKNLSIFRYGISLSSLEEIFFKLGDEEILGQIAAEDAAARNDDTFNLPSLESLNLKRRLTVLEADSVILPEGKRLRVSNNESEKNLSQLKYGTRGDLVSQKFKRSDGATFFRLLFTVIRLRFIQIIYNKVAFSIDVLFPVLMLLTSLFFREGGPGGVNLLKPHQNVKIEMSSYHQIFNSTIAYSVDSRLSGPSLTKTYSILKFLPNDIKCLLKRVDILTNEIFDSEFDEDKEIWDDDNPEKEFGPGGIHDSGLSDYAWKADKHPLSIRIQDTPIHGRAIRNFLYIKRDPHKYKNDVYSAGLSFEPWREKVHFQEGKAIPIDNFKLQVRIFYDAGLPHALPKMIAILNNALLAAAHLNIHDIHLKDSQVGHSPSKDPLEEHILSKAPSIDSLRHGPVQEPLGHNPEGNSIKSGTLSNMPYHIELESTPIFLDVPIYVTSLTYGMYIMLSLGLSSLPSRFGIQIMIDKFMGTKHAMIVMGLPFSTYWLGSFVMNYLAMLFGNFVVCGFIAYFIPTIFWSSAIIPVLICAVCFSASVLLWAYFLSQLFGNLKAYTMTLQLTGMVLALCPAYVVSVFCDASTSGAKKWMSTMLISHIVSSFLFPPYNPIGVLMGCAVIASEAMSINRTPTVQEYFQFDKLPIWSVIGAFVQAIVYYTATVLIDRKHYHMKEPPPGMEELLDIYYERRNMRREQWLQRRGGNQLLIPASLQNHKDEDVKAEEFETHKIHQILKGQERMYQSAKSNQEVIQEYSNQFQIAAIEDSLFPDELPLILIDDLHYLFLPTHSHGIPHIAVRGFSLNVYRGEIFGLLGPNGAGKTTSINLLTCNYAITAPTRGHALLGGHDVTRNPSAAFTHLGLCPQFDALFLDVTVRENLITFARIKNVPEIEINNVVNSFINELELEDHQFKRIGECSGGNRRRVSVAVAFMGNPDVVLMDEPSSGIDPIGRRRLAEMIHRNAEKRCVLITTHSMEEAEALCSRIGIIVNGELNCLNTSLAIRTCYGSGLRLEVIFDDESPNYIGFDPSGKTRNPWQQFLHNEISEDSEEIHRVANRATYDIPLKSDSLGFLFGLLEKRKKELAIKDYAMSQPTLEQVFITFAKRQKSAQESEQEIL